MLPQSLSRMGDVFRSLLVHIGELAPRIRQIWGVSCLCFTLFIIATGAPIIPSVFAGGLLGVSYAGYLYGLENLAARLRVTPVDTVQQQYVSGELSDAEFRDEIEEALLKQDE